MNANFEREFIEGYKEALRDPDRTKVLSLNALLGYDDGKEYTAEEYKQVANDLEWAASELGLQESAMIIKALQWCKDRSKTTRETQNGKASA